MDLFDRGFDPMSPLSSAAKHLTAAAARMTVSILNSFAHLPKSLWEEVHKLLTPDSLWALALVLAGWFLASVIGGLIGATVNALLLVYGLSDLWQRAGALWQALTQWCRGWYEASTEADLDAAGAQFAQVLSIGGIAVLEVALTHRAFKLAEGPLRKRFPAPEWLRRRFEEATRQKKQAFDLEAKRRSQGDAETNRGTRGVAEEPRRSRNSLDAALAVAELDGARKLAQDFPTVPVIAGLVGVASAVGVTWWAVSTASRTKP